MKAPIFAISRLRMGTDGPGVTTLVTLMGCPLHCKYCVNDICHEPFIDNPRVMLLTPQELYDKVKIDNIYFQATGGGICFGGGEPTHWGEFIEEFCNICDPHWKITIETSGVTDNHMIGLLAKVVDHWIVDIKSSDYRIYESYTGVKSHLYEHLKNLKKYVDIDKLFFKVPNIPDFTKPADVANSMLFLKEMGFKHIKEIQYVKRYIKGD